MKSAIQYLPRGLPNLLSAVRLASAPAIVFAIVTEHGALALALFLYAVFSDLADGPLARRTDQVTRLGGMLDHGADAAFVIAALAALAVRGVVPVVLPVLVAAAFAQYVLDSRATAGRPLRGNRLGRYNGIAYFVLVGVPVVRDGAGLDWPPDAFVNVLAWLLAASTLASMAARLYAQRAFRR